MNASVQTPTPCSDPDSLVRQPGALPRTQGPAPRWRGCALACTLLVALALAGCLDHDNDDAPPPATTVTDTSCLNATDPNPAAPVASGADARITITNDAAVLDTLITCSSATVAIGAASTAWSGAQPMRVGRGFSLTLVAEAAPPNIVGTAVFAGAGLNDATAGGTFTPVLSDPPYRRYIVDIDGTGSPDSFKWSDNDGASFTSGVAITGAAQALSDGVTVTFAATTGHTVGNRWRIDAGTLQATAVAMDGGTAVVSFAMIGEPRLGALQVYTLSGSTARLRSQALFRDMDINAVTLSGSTVYAIGASSPITAFPAVVESLTLTRTQLQLGGARAELHSFAGTHARHDPSMGKVYATDGNTGGLSVLDEATLDQAAYFPLDDARWVGLEGSLLVVAQGCCGTSASGQLSVYDLTGTPVLQNTFAFTGADVPEAKSTVEVLGAKAFVGAGSGGAQVIATTTGAVLASVPLPTGTGLAADKIVANAVSADEDLMFISFGEAGVYVAQEDTGNFTDTGAAGPVNLTVLGQLQFGSLQSVNHVAYSGRYLFVAAGLGGLKIALIRP